MKRFSLLALLLAVTVFTFAWAAGGHAGSRTQATGVCGCVDCHCPDCDGASCSCDSCDCGDCGCKAASLVVSAKTCCALASTTQTKAGCGCEVCKCPDCDGDVCTCDSCECLGCACAK